MAKNEEKPCSTHLKPIYCLSRQNFAISQTNFTKRICIKKLKIIKRGFIKNHRTLVKNCVNFIFTFIYRNPSSREASIIVQRYEPPARPVPPPGVEDFDIKNWNDPNQCSNYAMDIFYYYKSREVCNSCSIAFTRFILPVLIPCFYL